MEQKINGLKFVKTKFMKNANNCYTYAINQPFNPYTGKKYEDYDDCQPGFLGGVAKIRGLYDATRNYKVYMGYVKKDLKHIGYDIRKSTYKEYVEEEGAWKIAFCYDNINFDYHFYRQNIDGTWSHQQGCGGFVTNKDFDGKVITNPQKCERGRYRVFHGFYIITPIKERGN